MRTIRNIARPDRRYSFSMWSRVGLVVATTALAVLACRSSSTGSDAGSGASGAPLDYAIVTPARESGRSQPPEVFIDGVAQRELHVAYPSETVAATANHHIELRTGSTVLAMLDLRGADVEDCTFERPLVSVKSFTELVCEYDSGDLRLGTPSGTTRLPGGSDGQCVIDGSASCGPECTAWSCASGAHCTSIVTSHVPLYSHLGCVPIGTAQTGSACSFTAGSDGDHDNCGSASVCVAGTCRALCTPTCGTCETIDGEPSELSFCM